MKTLLSILFLVLVTNLLGQVSAERYQDSLKASFELDSITLIGCYGHLPNTGLLNISFRTAELSQLATGQEFLERKPGVAFRQNGSAGVSTLRINGLSGTRISLQWEGLEANDPQVGAIDVNELIPFLTPLSLPRLTTTAAPGQLNTTSYTQDISPSAVVNLFSGQGYSLGLSIPYKQTATRVFARLDNFEFQHASLQGRQRLEFDSAKGASLRQVGLTHTSNFLLSKKLPFTQKIYALTTQRTLPTTATEQQAGADLTSVTARYLVEANPKNSRFNLRLGALFNESVYNDEFRSIENNGRTLQVLARGQAEVSNRFNLTAEARYISAKNENYATSPTLGRGELSINYSQSKEKLEVTANAGLIGQTTTGVFPSGNLSVGLGKYVGYRPLSINIRKIARFPVLDDMYWASGGDIATNAEQGWEINLAARKYFGVAWEAHVYARQLDNFILWLPAQPFWRPTNAGSVRSAGGTLEVYKTTQLNKLELTFSANSAYTVAHSTLLQGPLPFNPTWMQGASIFAQRKAWIAELTTNFTGRQTTSFDESLPLPAYTVNNARLGYSHKALNLTLSVSNLFNAYIPNADGFPTPMQRIQLNFSYGS